MALKEIHHILAPQFPVKSAEEILEGQWLTFEAVSGETQVVLADGSTDRIIGVAGDTKSTSDASTPYSADLVVSPSGELRETQNRVSDMYDETAASGKMTTYMGAGGNFATDQISSSVTWANVTPGALLYVDASGDLVNADAGNGQAVAVFVQYGALESGVPGTDVNGSLSLGNYVTFISLI